MRIVVTGGAGFIGSALCRYLVKETDHAVLNIDALAYSGHLSTLREVEGHARYRFVREDIRNRENILALFRDFMPDAVMHLAAESHVDRSIDGPEAFVQSNVVGTFSLLQASRQYLEDRPAGGGDFVFHHVSTDEVYGTLPPDAPAFTEETPYAPNSPYAATKAASDHLVRAWGHTYGLPTVLSNCSNNYGPYQFPEKFLPVIILNALEGRPIPLYGRGDQVRDWLYVEDHARALYTVMRRGTRGTRYNVGGQCEKRNIDVARDVCRLLDGMRPRPDGTSYGALITHVADRPGHDARYAVDCRKIGAELGWAPACDFGAALAATVAWYLEHGDWCREVAGDIHRRRQGQAG